MGRTPQVCSAQLRPERAGISAEPQASGRRCVSVQLAGGLHAVTDLEFGQDGLDVVAHGLRTEVQGRSDGGVTVPGGQQVGDLSLTPGEAVWIDLAEAGPPASGRPT